MLWKHKFTEYEGLFDERDRSKGGKDYRMIYERYLEAWCAYKQISMGSSEISRKESMIALLTSIDDSLSMNATQLRYALDLSHHEDDVNSIPDHEKVNCFLFWEEKKGN